MELALLRLWKMTDRETVVFSRMPLINDAVWIPEPEGDETLMGWVTYITWEDDPHTPHGRYTRVEILKPGVPSLSTTFRFLVEAEPAPFVFPDVSQA
jgi:hypothetical protein